MVLGALFDIITEKIKYIIKSDQETEWGRTFKWGLVNILVLSAEEERIKSPKGLKVAA